MQSKFVQNNSHFFGNETISITRYHVLNAGRSPHVCDESAAFHVWSTSTHTISDVGHVMCVFLCLGCVLYTIQLSTWKYLNKLSKSNVLLKAC